MVVRNAPVTPGRQNFDRGVGRNARICEEVDLFAYSTTFTYVRQGP